MGLLFLLKMSVELKYGLENMFFPVDNSAQIEKEREEYNYEQDCKLDQIMQLKEFNQFPKLQKNFLDNVLDDQGLQWLYNGLSNVATTNMNYLLNPEEIVKLYVGVWRYKELRDHRNTELPGKPFHEMVPYLIGMGENTLGQKHLKKSKQKKSSSKKEYSLPLGNRIILMTDENKVDFKFSLLDEIKVPGRDFFKPESRIRPGLDATARKVYLNEIVKQVYQD